MTGPGPRPSASLPHVRVHGATSVRRHVLLGLLAGLPGLVPFVSSLVAPRSYASSTLDVLAGGTLVLLVSIWTARSFVPLARWSRHVSASLVAVGWGLCAMATSVGRDSETWSAIAVLGVVAATLAGCWLGWWVGGLRFGMVGPLVAPAAHTVAPTARTAWSEVAMRPLAVASLLVLAATMAALTALPAGSVVTPWWTPSFAFLLVVSALPFAIRVTADRRGLRIRSRVLGIPLVTVPIERIRAVAAATIDGEEWGRVGSTADRELTTIVHRSGPALIVTRTDGSMVVVTVARPDEAASVLEALRIAHPGDGRA